MLIHIVDTKGKPIGAMKEDKVHEQGLLHKRLILVLYDKEKRLCIKKQVSNDGDYVWDFPVNTHIPLGMSEEELAEKNLQKFSSRKGPIDILIRNHMLSRKNELISIYLTKNIKIDGYEFIFLDREEFDFAVKKYRKIFFLPTYTGHI